LDKVRSELGSDDDRITIKEFYLALGEQCRLLWNERKDETQEWRMHILGNLEKEDEREKLFRFLANNEDRVYQMEGNGGTKITEAFEVSTASDSQVVIGVSETVVNRTEREAEDRYSIINPKERNQDNAAFLEEPASTGNFSTAASADKENKIRQMGSVMESSKVKAHNFRKLTDAHTTQPEPVEKMERRPKKRPKRKSLDKKIAEEMQDSITQLQKQSAEQNAGQIELRNQMVGISNSLNSIMTMLQTQGAGNNTSGTPTSENNTNNTQAARNNASGKPTSKNNTKKKRGRN